MTIRNRASLRSTRTRLSSPGRPRVALRSQQVIFWALIKQGVSSAEAGVRVGASAPVGGRWFREAGGMPPSKFANSSTPLSGRYLCFSEREEIALYRARGLGVRAIARKIGRSASTISRELRRNAATRSRGFEYRATTAQWHADRAPRRSKATKLCKSLTWDQGAEMAQHAKLKTETGIRGFFCDPQSPWQRASNENTNGLLRQYFPKGTDLGVHDENALDAVAYTLNNRPRKTLGWKTPEEALEKALS